MSTATGYKYTIETVTKDFADVFTIASPAGTQTTGYKSTAYGGKDLGVIFAAGNSGITTSYKNSAGIDLGSLLSNSIIPIGTWSVLGTGITASNPIVNSIAISSSNSNIYVGGQFTTAGGVSASNIAVWNGSSWSALGTGVTGTSYPVVNSIAISSSNSNDVYVGGQFTTAGGASVSNIAVWNGSSWSALGTGVTGSNPIVYSITISGSNIYVGGQFTTAGGVSASNIAIYNSNTDLWSALGPGVTGTSYPVVNSIAISGGNIYVGGRFTTAGGVSVNNIAMWNGSTWSALGTGVTGTGTIEVKSIAISGSNIYVGGIFAYAGAVSANNIAIYNSNTDLWSALGTGVTGSYPMVDSIAISGSNIYVGGQFTTAGGLYVNNIAMIIGTTWYNIGNISGSSPYVSSVAVDTVNKMYAGGVFTTAGGVAVNNIAKYTP